MWTRAGLGVTLELEGLLLMPHIMAGFDWFEEAIWAAYGEGQRAQPQGQQKLY